MSKPPQQPPSLGLTHPFYEKGIKRKVLEEAIEYLKAQSPNGNYKTVQPHSLPTAYTGQPDQEESEPSIDLRGYMNLALKGGSLSVIVGATIGTILGGSVAYYTGFGKKGWEEDVHPMYIVPDTPYAVLEDTETVKVTASGTKEFISPAHPPIYKTGDALYDQTGRELIIASVHRDVKEQARLFYDNCMTNYWNTCKVDTCNPGNSSVITGNSNKGYTMPGEWRMTRDRIIKKLADNPKDPMPCAHTAKIAVDAWCGCDEELPGCGDTKGWVHDPICQHTLTQIMAEHGMCRITNEAWHNEWHDGEASEYCRLDGEATYRTGGKTYNPLIDGAGDDCGLWNFSTNECVMKCAKIEDGKCVELGGKAFRPLIKTPSWLEGWF